MLRLQPFICDESDETVKLTDGQTADGFAEMMEVVCRLHIPRMQVGGRANEFSFFQVTDRFFFIIFG